uniref:Uncharacterized protein n=1 Tax=Megaselia scalaris TaxID=36166 RepID=T1H3V6_MEGSC
DYTIGRQPNCDNFHNLIHIYDDVLNFGPLDNFSAFKFENFIQSLIKDIRKPEKIIQELYHRYMERDTIENAKKLTDFNEENFNIEENADAFENAATDALETVERLKTRFSKVGYRLKCTAFKIKKFVNTFKLYEHNLPSDQRTLLSTPRKCPINICEFGEYKYFGVESSLEKILEKNRIEFLPTELSLTLCIDDVPINKEVSITATFNIEMSKFIADTVAKSKILKIKGHTGYLRCTKCWVHGELKNNRLYFKDTRAKKHYTIGRQPNCDNFHNLIHIYDVLNFGPLDNFSAFKFENFMHFLIKDIRKPDKIIQQLYHRYMERDTIENAKSNEKTFKNITAPGPTVDNMVGIHYSKIKFGNFIINTKNNGDNCFQIGDE